LIVEALVLAFVAVTVDDALFDQKAAPEIIAVTPEQGIVEIEKGQGHVRCSAGCYEGAKDRGLRPAGKRSKHTVSGFAGAGADVRESSHKLGDFIRYSSD